MYSKKQENALMVIIARVLGISLRESLRRIALRRESRTRGTSGVLRESGMH